MQSRPLFTIAIGDKHVDEKTDVTWTCEAFGIPDVEYEWLKNGRVMPKDNRTLDPEDRSVFLVENLYSIQVYHMTIYDHGLIVLFRERCWLTVGDLLYFSTI